MSPLPDALRLVVSQFGGRWQSGSTDTSRFEFHLRTIAKVKPEQQKRQQQLADEEDRGTDHDIEQRQ